MNSDDDRSLKTQDSKLASDIGEEGKLEEDSELNFGGFPDKDLNKNLGCG